MSAKWNNCTTVKKSNFSHISPKILYYNIDNKVKKNNNNVNNDII